MRYFAIIAAMLALLVVDLPWWAAILALAVIYIGAGSLLGSFLGKRSEGYPIVRVDLDVDSFKEDLRRATRRDVR